MKVHYQIGMMEFHFQGNSNFYYIVSLMSVFISFDLRCLLSFFLFNGVVCELGAFSSFPCVLFEFTHTLISVVNVGKDISDSIGEGCLGSFPS